AIIDGKCRQERQIALEHIEEMLVVLRQEEPHLLPTAVLEGDVYDELFGRYFQAACHRSPMSTAPIPAAVRGPLSHRILGGVSAGVSRGDTKCGDTRSASEARREPSPARRPGQVPRAPCVARAVTLSSALPGRDQMCSSSRP